MAGKTGMPLVDACMRELAASGFMSNRGRQNVASYFIHKLGLDWRLGAAYFESVLLDYDECSNWGNWVSAAGLTGGRINIFNIIKQSLEYDAEGDFVRHWVAELSGIPGAAVHTPHRLSLDEQKSAGLNVGETYPINRNQLDRMADAAHGGGPRTAQARWEQPRYLPPKKSFRPKSDFERYG
jgi:deoxyribodipyrimidine photo-lyase